MHKALEKVVLFTSFIGLSACALDSEYPPEDSLNDEGAPEQNESRNVSIDYLKIEQEGADTTADPSIAAAACYFSGDSLYGVVGTHYPVTLHGTSIGLRSGVSTAAAYAIGTLRAGDIISIDRANFTVSGPDSHYWLTTDQVQARGTWDYCEQKVPTNGTFATWPTDGAHRPVRVCLRRSGALQCAGWWYADNDDG